MGGKMWKRYGMCLMTAAVLLWSGACGRKGEDGAGAFHETEQAVTEEQGGAAQGAEEWDGAARGAEEQDGSAQDTEQSGGIQGAGQAGAAQGAGVAALDPQGKDLLRFQEPDMVDPALLEELTEYAVSVESWIEDTVFRPIEGEQVKELSGLLSGHYAVAGRDGGDGRVYYLAARRKDAPVYEDFFGGMFVGYVDDLLQIGYAHPDSSETILYEIPGFSVNTFSEKQGREVLDLFCFIPDTAEDDQAFTHAFSRSGRQELAFLKAHPGLSFYEEGAPCIRFLYQDRDTVQFWSEPYPCYIPLEEADCRVLRELLGTGGHEPEQTISQELGRTVGQEAERAPDPEKWAGPFETYKDAQDHAKEQSPSIRTTGAQICLNGMVYELLGGQGCDGCLLVYREEDGSGKEDIWLLYDQEVFSYAIDWIKAVTGKDYSDFTDRWFDLPLRSATLEYPRPETGEDGEMAFVTRTQTVTEEEKLEWLSQLLEDAIQGHEALSGCPYKGVLELTRSDGETLQMFVAADSCDSITYEGRIGFEYGSLEEMAAIFDEAME